MELQLTLALPTYDPKGTFYLNKHEFKPKGMARLKRGFEEAFGKNREECRTKNLLLWSGQPNEEDDGNSPKITSSPTNKDDEEEDGVVGWPPIKSSRKKLFHQINQVVGRRENNNGRSMYVKVKMEGVAITRKVDMRLFDSYQALTNSLISMFAHNYDDKDGAGNRIIYQDKDGDWLLVGDVPWQTFIGSVQRLEILRNYN
ncbi:hypothetical protein SLEP1_g1710 [Rubroshorea leprosula]|uniref:Auxin-responsive protein n=1 Tax=Rubroshorea leprosula TaxID=152421 RepID=A0AAV5HLT9_9ROSI|nr:hypothetical protein SLEP1_g1710 [Rubroshorea leprosula]